MLLEMEVIIICWGSTSPSKLQDPTMSLGHSQFIKIKIVPSTILGAYLIFVK